VTAIDRDPKAIATATERLRPHIDRGTLRVLEGNFADIDELPEIAGERFDGVLLDLGVSSHQFDAEERGFTFRRGAPLDMRMGNDAERTAADFLNDVSQDDLTAMLRQYADEPRSHRMAGEIVRRRRNTRFATSDDLVGAIRAVLGPSAGPAEFARIFQAIRIAVNDEIPGLERGLPALRAVLAPGGIMAVIAYHSGEDRVVKHAFQEWSRSCICPPRQPVCNCRGRALGTTLTRKPMSAQDDEIAANPRARSAHLRAWRSAA
jgi:16S rRNA (cytosine1402-N4)-methyltransferase